MFSQQVRGAKTPGARSFAGGCCTATTLWSQSQREAVLVEEQPLREASVAHIFRDLRVEDANITYIKIE